MFISNSTRNESTCVDSEEGNSQGTFHGSFVRSKPLVFLPLRNSSGNGDSADPVGDSNSKTLGSPPSPDFPLQMRNLALTDWYASMAHERSYNEWSLGDLGHSYLSDVVGEGPDIQNSNSMDWFDTSSREIPQRNGAQDGNYAADERDQKEVELHQRPHYPNKERDSMLQGRNSGNPCSADAAFTASSRHTDALSAAFTDHHQQQAQWQAEEHKSNQTMVEVEENLNGTQQDHERLTADITVVPTSANLQILENSKRLSGRRVGPLSEEGRRNARAMRKLNSCFRCFFMREKCILDDQSIRDGVCKRCRQMLNSYRAWSLPCSLIRLEERTTFMLPSYIVHQLRESEVSSFIKDHVAGVVPGSSIKLRLTMGFGEPLSLDAVEFIPRGYKNTHLAHCDRPSNLFSTLDPLEDLPVMPFLVDRRVITRHVNHWIDSLIREPHTNLPVYCFPDSQDLWLREILTCICRYHQMNISKLEADGQGPYHTLRWALRLTLLNYIMCHHFIVPDQEVENLRHRLQNFQINWLSGTLCPSIANRIIKSGLLPMLTKAVEIVLGDLQRLLDLRCNESEQWNLWDQTFCIVFLCLTVVGNFQASLVERAENTLADHVDSFTLKDAMSGVLEMEGELSIHLIGMFHTRFGTTRKGSDGWTFNPLARSPAGPSSYISEFSESIRSAVNIYGHAIPKTTEVEEVELTRLKSENVARLLAKFMQPFYQGIEFSNDDFLIDPAIIAGLRTMCSSVVLDEHSPKTWLDVRVWSEDNPQCRREQLALIDTGADKTDCISDEFYHELKIQNCEQAERDLMWGDDQRPVVLGRVKLYFAWAGPGGKKKPSIEKRKFYVVQNLGVPMSFSAQANEALKLMEYATTLPKLVIGKHLHGPLFTSMTKAEKEQERIREKAVRIAAKVEEEQEKEARAAKRRMLQDLPSQDNSSESMPSGV